MSELHVFIQLRPCAALTKPTDGLSGQKSSLEVLLAYREAQRKVLMGNYYENNSISEEQIDSPL